MHSPCLTCSAPRRAPVTTVAGEDYSTSKSLTVSVVDLAHGHSAEGVPVHLLSRPIDQWRQVADARTDEGGLASLLPPEGLARGLYRIECDVGSYFAALGQVAFHPIVAVVFRVTDPDLRYHIPVLMAPNFHLTYNLLPSQ